MRDSKGRFVEGNFKDYTGIKRGRLTFVKMDHIHYTPAGKKIPYWICECECGTEKVLSSKDVSSGHTKSCGCLQKERASKANKTHGETGTQLYRAWENMKKRCTNPKSERFKTYGARGIKVCDDWLEYTNFSKWAKANGYKEGLTIDRIDVDKNYEPQNCQWIPMEEQATNRTTTILIEIGGETYLVSELAEKYNLTADTIYKRLENGDEGQDLIRPWKTRRR